MAARAPLEVELLSGSTRLGLHGAITAPSSALMGLRASNKSLTAGIHARLAALWPRRCHRTMVSCSSRARPALAETTARQGWSSEGRPLCPPRSQNSGRNRDGDRVSTPSRKCVNRIAELNAVGQQQRDQDFTTTWSHMPRDKSGETDVASEKLLERRHTIGSQSGQDRRRIIRRSLNIKWSENPKCPAPSQ